MVEMVMTAIYPDAKDLCPCVGTLSLRVVIRMWGELTDSAENTERKAVASTLSDFLNRHPEGGRLFLDGVVEEGTRSIERGEQVEIWSYVTNLAQRS